jgi:hypothetical protein
MLRVEDAFEPSNSGLILGYDENKCCKLKMMSMVELGRV